MQMTWLNKRHRIKGLAKHRAWIVWTHGPPDHDHARALKEGVIMALMKRVGGGGGGGASQPLDRDCELRRFITHLNRRHLSASS